MTALSRSVIAINFISFPHPIQPPKKCGTDSFLLAASSHKSFSVFFFLSFHDLVSQCNLTFFCISSHIKIHKLGGQ